MCFSFRAKAHFSLKLKDYVYAAAQILPTFTQAQLKLAVVITRAQYGTVLEYLRKLVHLGISLNSHVALSLNFLALTATLPVKAQFECPYRTHHQTLDFSRYSPSMGSTPTLSQQTTTNNQGKPRKSCNKYLAL